MRERPILFSAPMVRAILDCQKTQTRRVLKPQPDHIEWNSPINGWCARTPEGLYEMRVCPYGQPGDRLWVRETWAAEDVGNPARVSIDYRATSTGKLSGSVRDRPAGFSLREPAHGASGDTDSVWRPSIHMPRWASRITLEVTGVRVERLQYIDDDDARAEGVENRGAFAELWESVHGPGAWDANPWVWVVSFKRVGAA